MWVGVLFCAMHIVVTTRLPHWSLRPRRLRHCHVQGARGTSLGRRHRLIWCHIYLFKHPRSHLATHASLHPPPSPRRSSRDSPCGAGAWSIPAGEGETVGLITGVGLIHSSLPFVSADLLGIHYMGATSQISSRGCAGHAVLPDLPLRFWPLLYLPHGDCRNDHLTGCATCS